MNRSTFFKTLAAGIVAAPAAALAAEKPSLPRATKLVCEIPSEAGKVVSMMHYQDHVWMACENGVYYWPAK